MPVRFELLTTGMNYDRNYLAGIWGYQDWHAIGRGVVTPSGDNKIVLFVTKEKQESLTQYVDRFEDDLLYMEGESNHAADVRIVNSLYSNDEVYLFYRRIHHSPFTYYGRVYLATYSLLSDDASKFVFSTSKADAISIGSQTTEEETHGDNEDGYIPDDEGRRRLRQHICYERSRRNRRRAIEVHGTKCKVCGFDFNSFYGNDLARDYIEIHHIKSIAESEGPVDPDNDLIPLCSNCHSMVHRDRTRIMPIAELRVLLRTYRTDGGNV